MNKQKKEIKIYCFVKAGRGQSNKQNSTGPEAIISSLGDIKKQAQTESGKQHQKDLNEFQWIPPVCEEQERIQFGVTQTKKLTVLHLLKWI